MVGWPNWVLQAVVCLYQLLRLWYFMILSFLSLETNIFFEKIVSIDYKFYFILYCIDVVDQELATYSL